VIKKQLVYGTTVIIAGLLVALGPQFLFKVCNVMDENFPICHWSAQAEIGTGILITALGICILLFLDESKIRLGLSIGIFFTNIVALLIPHVLIGGCNMMSMRCRRIAFPILSAICIVLLLTTITNIIYLGMKDRNALNGGDSVKSGGAV
jgi:hypothetical protein